MTPAILASLAPASKGTPIGARDDMDDCTNGV